MDHYHLIKLHSKPQLQGEDPMKSMRLFYIVIILALTSMACFSTSTQSALSDFLTPARNGIRSLIAQAPQIITTTHIASS
jgi:hypothetical protein